jgi:hypothetical protein
MISYTKDTWCFGIKDSDNEITVADGVPVAEVISTDCTPEEFQGNCELIVRAPLLYKALEAWAFADADPECARRKGYYDNAREQRDELLRQLGSPAVGPAKLRRRQ